MPLPAPDLLSEGDGNLLVRTDFTAQQVWDDLLERVDHHTKEGLLTGVRIVDDPAYEGMTAEQLLDLVPDDSGCVYIAVADAQTTAPDCRIQDRTLLIVNVDPGEEEHGNAFRAAVSEFASIDANLFLANTQFSEYQDGVGDNGVYQGGHVFAKGLGAQHLEQRLEGRPILTELWPGDTLRLGSLSSESGAFFLVNQDDGDVVIYRAQDGVAVWRTGTLLEDELRRLSSRLVLQGNGNLVLFAPTGTQLWSSGTKGRDVQRAVLGDDGRLTLVNADGDEVWSTETA